MANLNIRGFPDELMVALKVRAAERGITLRKEVIERLATILAKPLPRQGSHPDAPTEAQAKVRGPASDAAINANPTGIAAVAPPIEGPLAGGEAARFEEQAGNIRVPLSRPQPAQFPGKKP